MSSTLFHYEDDPSFFSWSDGWGPTVGDDLAISGRLPQALQTAQLAHLAAASRIRTLFDRFLKVDRFSSGRPCLASRLEGQTDADIADLRELNALTLVALWRLNDHERSHRAAAPARKFRLLVRSTIAPEKLQLLGILIDYAASARFLDFECQCAEWYRQAGAYEMALACLQRADQGSAWLEPIRGRCKSATPSLFALPLGDQQCTQRLQALVSYTPVEDRIQRAIDRAHSLADSKRA